MRSGFLWLVSFAAFPAAGAPLLMHRAFRLYGIPARLVLSAAAGAVAISETMTVASLFGWRWNVPALVLCGMAECLALRLALGREEPADRRGDAALSNAARAALVLSALAILAAGVAALTACATSPDLVLFWGPKAEAFAAARGLDAGYLGDPIHLYQHRSYPPLVTNVFAFATLAARGGRFPWLAAVATFPMLVAGLAIGLPGILRRSVSRSDALVGAAAITASAGFLGVAVEMAGNADPVILFFGTLAVALLLGPAGQERSGQLLAGLLLAGAAASKVEGLPFAAAAVGSFFLLRRRAVSAPAIVLLTLPTLLSLGAWFAFGRRTGVFFAYETYGPTLEVHLERLGLVLAGIARSLADAGAATPWLVPLAALAIARRKSRGALYPAAIAGILGAFFVFTYLHGDVDPSLWISWSSGRVFALLSPLLVLAVIAGRVPGAAVGEEEEEEGRSPAKRG
jgi:hypothetical protein